MGEDFHKLETLIFSLLFNSFTKTTKKKQQSENLLGKKCLYKHILVMNNNIQILVIFFLKKIVLGYFRFAAISLLQHMILAPPKEIWDLSSQIGMEHDSPELEGRFLTTRLPGKSL